MGTAIADGDREGVDDLNATTETIRLETFSDGVFAIAITLLVLEIKVPSIAEARAVGGLWRALGQRWPSYLGYIISFITLGIMWANHHAIFQYIRRADRVFLLLHVLFLMCISFLPFPTAVLAAHLAAPDERVTAVVFYSATLTAIAMAYNAVWWYGVSGGRLLGREVDPDGLHTISQRYRLGPPAYLVSVGLAYVSVAASLTLHVVLALLFALPERRKKRHS
jgi:uncharacterized membrane protein